MTWDIPGWEVGFLLRYSHGYKVGFSLLLLLLYLLLHIFAAEIYNNNNNNNNFIISKDDRHVIYNSDTLLVVHVYKCIFVCDYDDMCCKRLIQVQCLNKANFLQCLMFNTICSTVRMSISCKQILCVHMCVL